MTRPKKRKANNKIIKAITPDSPISKKLCGCNLPIQTPDMQSDKPSSPVISSPIFYQVMPAVRFKASYNISIVALILPLMSTQARPMPIVEKDSYVAILPMLAPVEPIYISLNNFWLTYKDNNIKALLAWSRNEQKYKINVQYIEL